MTHYLKPGDDAKVIGDSPSRYIAERFDEKERQSRIHSVVIELTAYGLEWPRLYNLIETRSFVSDSDPDIGRVKEMGDKLKASVARLRTGDIGADNIVALTKLATEMQNFGTRISRAFAPSYVFDSPQDMVAEGNSLLKRVDISVAVLTGNKGLAF